MNRKRARMGRPPKPKADKQSCQVSVKLTPGELRRLRSEAKRAGMSLAGWIMKPHRED